MITIIAMPVITRAFNRVRTELSAAGLLEPGKYLDRIDCVRAAWPELDTFGYVMGEPGPFWRFWGFERGTIYLPPNAIHTPRVPGETLTDTIRHEFGHAWEWLDPSYFGQPWFRRAFGGNYGPEWDNASAPQYDRAEFVSRYAATSPQEDFAETFMTYLRCRENLSRFAPRRGLHTKLLRVERAVRSAAKTRAARVRGPRFR